MLSRKKINEIYSTNIRLDIIKHVEPTSFLPYYFDIDVNEEGLILMASNNFKTYIYDGKSFHLISDLIQLIDYN